MFKLENSLGLDPEKIHKNLINNKFWHQNSNDESKQKELIDQLIQKTCYVSSQYSQKITFHSSELGRKIMLSYDSQSNAVIPYLFLTRTKRCGDPVLGSGHLKQAKSAWNLLSGKSVVVCTNKKFSGDKKKNLSTMRKEAFSMIKEAELMSQLDHKGILKVYDYFYTDEKDLFGDNEELIKKPPKAHVISQRCVDDLCSKLRNINRKDMTTMKSVMRFVNEIASAIEWLHQQGIIHGDIKLENMLLDEEGHVKIGDFEFSFCEAEPAGKISRLFGTKEFIAPELYDMACCSEKKPYPYGRKTDVWAFGCLLFEIITGKNFLFGPSDRLVGKMDKFISYAWNLIGDIFGKEVGEEMKLILNGALEIQPEKRWDMEQCKAALEKITEKVNSSVTNPAV